MLEIFTVAFFGHRYIDNPFKVEEQLEEQIRKLINEKEYVDFFVGRNGEFDQCVSSAVLRVRKIIGMITVRSYWRCLMQRQSI